MQEKSKIKALIEAIQALQEEGYELYHGDHFKDVTAISERGKQFRVKTLNFMLNKYVPLEGDEKELMELIQSCNRSCQAGNATKATPLQQW
jgi:hypothetical protein